MRVIRHGREDLEIELSGVNYYFWGGFGRGEISSVFLVLDMYKVAEEYSISMGKRIKNLRYPEYPYTTRLTDIDEQEKQWVRETVCAEWEKDDSRYTSCCDISFYDEKGNLLCTNDNRTNVLTVSDLHLEIHMDGTIVRFKGDHKNDTFAALASSMMWLHPTERKATEEEFDACFKKLKQYYRTLLQKNRRRIVFVNDKGKKLCSIR